MHFVREESVSLDRTGVVLCDAHEGDNGSKRLFFRSEYWVPNARMLRNHQSQARMSARNPGSSEARGK
jgi:hypothetical protein